MMTLTMKRPVTLIAGTSILLLTACGGGGSSTDTLTPPINPFTLTSGALSAQVLDQSGGTVAAQSGAVDVSDGTFTIGDLAGTVNVDTNIATLTSGSGGGVTLTGDGTTYVARFDASPIGDTRTIGVVGAATSAGDLPSGEAAYSGTTTVTVVDGTNVYDLTGDVSVNAVFDASTPSVTTTLDNLDGTRSDVISAAVAVTDVATVTISGSTIAGAGFSGGTASLTSEDITALTAGTTTALQGGFYGPNGEEVGGVGIVDSTANIAFDFIGRQ
jgi:hypothetical protein